MIVGIQGKSLQGAGSNQHGFVVNQFGTRRQPIIGQAKDSGIREVPAPDVELTVICIAV